MTGRGFLPCLVAALLLPGCAPRAAPAREPPPSPLPEIVGPMVGSVSSDEARLWAWVRDGRAPVVVYRPFAAAQGEERRETKKVAPGEHGAARALLPGLSASTTYTYRLEVDGGTEPAWCGRFRTAPEPGRPARFVVAVSSCMDFRRCPDQPAWRALLRAGPAFQLLIGDNVYADSTDREVLWAAHLTQRRVPSFAAVLRRVPTFATWDDHDFARNDSDGTAPGKEESLRTFAELFANPGAGTPEVPGTFFRFAWGDVDVFVLDCRYHRSPDRDPDGPEKEMIGEGQLRWLLDGLRASRARFKVVASSSTLSLSPTDGWALYGHARERLFRGIAESGAEGVILVSGDIHRRAFVMHPPRVTGCYPIPEVVSSGIAVFHGERNGYATMAFDTTLSDPTVRVRLLREDGTPEGEHVIRWSSLRREDR